MNKKAFTLIELLLAMFVLSLIMHSTYTYFHAFKKTYEYTKEDRSADFKQFLMVLENELERLEVVEVDTESGVIYVRDDSKKRPSSHIIDCFNNQIVKRRTGFQPYLLDVNDWSLGLVENDLWIGVEFLDGGYYTGRVGLKDEEIK